jgi:uncharacterized protein (DUF2267 family)
MTRQNVPMIDRTVQETHIWLKELCDDLGTEDQRQAYHALREVLIVTRDTLIPEEAMDLASQLPTLVRGIFFEGYKIAGKPDPKRHAEQFVEQVHQRLASQNQSIEPERAIRSVFKVLKRHISDGEAQQVKQMLHKEVQAYWPEAA